MEPEIVFGMAIAGIGLAVYAYMRLRGMVREDALKEAKDAMDDIEDIAGDAIDKIK